MPRRKEQGADTRAAVIKAIGSSGYRELRKLDFKVVEGMVIVSGVVSSFYLKQVAQEIICRVEGIEEVRYLVEVKDP